MKTLALIIALFVSSTANAGLVFFDFESDDSTLTGVASASGFVDTIQNRFTLTSITMPTNIPMKTPNSLPLVFEAVQTSALLSWDVPDNATAQDIIDQINLGDRGFLLVGRNSNYSWTPNTFVVNATAGWGVGVQNRGTGAQFVQYLGADNFQRFPQIANGTAPIFWSSVGEITAVPEPSSLVLAGLVCVPFLWRLRRGRN